MKKTIITNELVYTFDGDEIIIYKGTIRGVVEHITGKIFGAIKKVYEYGETYFIINGVNCSVVTFYEELSFFLENNKEKKEETEEKIEKIENSLLNILENNEEFEKLSLAIKEEGFKNNFKNIENIIDGYTSQGFCKRFKII